MSKDMTTIVIQTPGEMNLLHRIRDFITGVAVESGIDEQDIANIELAVDEACANIIEHGYASDAPDKSITIKMEIDPSKLVLKIFDRGGFYDPRNVPPADIKKLIKEKRNGGIGIWLMTQIMDEIDYRRTADGQNELTLVKYLKPMNADKEIHS